MIKKIIAIILLWSAVMTAVGCNTVHGIGQDIQKAGEKTQEAADAVKRKL